MPVTVLEMQLLGVGSDGFLALGAGVGAELLEALDAAVAALLLHVLLPLQRVAAVVTVKPLRHGAHRVTARPSCVPVESHGQQPKVTSSPLGDRVHSLLAD